MKRHRSTRYAVQIKRIKELYLPLTDRLWFPIPHDKMKDMRLIDLNVPPLHNFHRFVIAVHKNDADRLPKAGTPREFLTAMHEFESAVMGRRIPTKSLDMNWNTRFHISAPPEEQDFIKVVECIARVALATMIKPAETSFQPFPPEMIYTDSPLHALKLGVATSTESASLLAAALRKNRIPARIVGNREMLLGNDYWWVEAHIDSGEEVGWVPAEAFIAPTHMRSIMHQARALGINGEDLVQAVIQYMAQVKLQHKSLAVADHPDGAEKAKTRFLVAERDLPASSTN
ncbi:transglutaminase domain-containing protein [Candidatus Micrarchaeota archaeon]|nr:transglutaminase domain-containing protein [Candidatus Micrarchaeota archaeon]